MEYGLIGAKLGHSYSKIIHERLGEYAYELCPLPTEEEARAFLEKRDFKALNVTSPYKQLVIPYCDEVDEGARSIGAVNTLVNRGGRLYGVAHNGFTQGAVTHQGGRIDAGPGLFRRGQIVRHGGIPAGGRHGAAAVAAHIGGDTLQDAAFRRGAAQKGAVTVGMDIDKAGSEIQASGVHSLRGFTGQLSQGGDTAVLYRQIAVKPGRAGAVHDPGVTDK